MIDFRHSMALDNQIIPVGKGTKKIDLKHSLVLGDQIIHIEDDTV